MHKILFSFGVIAVLAAALITPGCKAKTGEFQEAYDHQAAISHSWKLTSVVQIDKLVNPQETMNVDSYMLGANAAEISFNADYSYTLTLNDSKIGIGTTGSWEFDDPDYPSVVLLSSNGKTYRMNLESSIRPFDTELVLGLDHCGDNKFVVKYTFSKL